MRTRFEIFATIGLVLVMLILSGCATGGGDRQSLVQRILTAKLPPDFRGDAHVQEKTAWFKFELRAGDLRREGGRWVWTWLTYQGDSPFTDTTFTFGQPAPVLRGTFVPSHPMLIPAPQL